MDLVSVFLDAPIASVLFVITIITSMMAFKDGNLKYNFIFNPYRMVRNKEWHMPITSGLIHANGMHLGMNMLVFFFFAFQLEVIIGHWAFFILYMFSLIVSSFPALIQHKDNELYNALGASGAVSAVVMSFILFNPAQDLRFILIPIDIPAWLMGVGYIVYSFWASFKSNDNIGHDAHLWGALAGIAITVLMRPDAATGFLNWLGGYF